MIHHTFFYKEEEASIANATVLPYQKALQTINNEKGGVC